jgi:hypothetical protein
MLSRPTGDPVDSDRILQSPVGVTDGLALRGLSYPSRMLTVFSHLACSEMHLLPEYFSISRETMNLNLSRSPYVLKQFFTAPNCSHNKKVKV